MKCPLIKTSLKVDGKIFPLVPADCIKADCAWWHIGLEECKLALLEEAISTIMGTFLRLTLDLDKSGKLPHWKPED